MMHSRVSHSALVLGCLAAAWGDWQPHRLSPVLLHHLQRPAIFIRFCTKTAITDGSNVGGQIGDNNNIKAFREASPRTANCCWRWKDDAHRTKSLGCLNINIDIICIRFTCFYSACAGWIFCAFSDMFKILWLNLGFKKKSGYPS